MLDMRTTAPPPFALMNGRNARTAHTAPSTLTSKEASNCATVAELLREVKIAAQCTKLATRPPHRAAKSAQAAATAEASRTSNSKKATRSEATS